jgi:hypothetical protein
MHPLTKRFSRAVLLIVFFAMLTTCLWGCQNIQEAEPDIRTRIFDAPYGKVFDVSRQYMLDNGYPIAVADRQNGILSSEFRIRADVRTKLNMNFTELNPTRTQVVVFLSEEVPVRGGGGVQIASGAVFWEPFIGRTGAYIKRQYENVFNEIRKRL